MINQNNIFIKILKFIFSIQFFFHLVFYPLIIFLNLLSGSNSNKFINAFAICSYNIVDPQLGNRDSYRNKYSGNWPNFNVEVCKHLLDERVSIL